MESERCNFFAQAKAPNPSLTILYVVLFNQDFKDNCFEAAGDGISQGYVDISSGVRVRANHGVSRAKTVLLPSTRIIHIRAAGGPLAQS